MGVNGRDFFFRDGEDSPLVAALHLDVLESGANLSVSAHDEMFKIFYYGRGESRDLALHMYLESGKRIWRTLRRVIEWHFGPLGGVESLLDFAAGYGRVTRFTAADLPPDRIWITEIDPGAVRFQEETFGVHGFETTACPEEFRPGRDFECILVSSLFTHLPEESFLGWLARLLSLVRPGGLLALSVHDMALLEEPGEEPFVFREQSESGSLPTSEYGSTWVRESYVRELIATAGGGARLATLRIPRGLASYQDLYVVTKDAPLRGPGRQEELLGALRGGADGFLEDCRLSASRRLSMKGWVTDRYTKQPVRELRVDLDGRPAARTAELLDRPEVAAVFPGDAAGGQGWRIEVPLPPASRFSAATLRLLARGDDGFESCLLEGTVEDVLCRAALFRNAQLESERSHLEAERDHAVLHAEALRLELAEAAARHAQELERWGQHAAGLHAQIAAMKASRFWKLRDRWFALKRLLRLTTEA